MFAASPADIAILGGAAGPGKRLCISTPIPTPSGWSTMGDLRPGDVVFDENGNPTTVTAAHPIAIARDCYRLTFDDGSEIEADAQHLWHTFTAADLSAMSRRTPEARAKRRAKRNRSGKRRPDLSHGIKPSPTGDVRTTAEIVATLRNRGRANHAISVAGTLSLPSASLPIDPYLLGIWLGDGTSREGAITTADAEVIQSIRTAGYTVNKWSSPYAWGIVGLTVQLKAAGLVNNKHAPAEYMRASAEQRRELLAGLLDSDGHATRDGGVEFTGTDRRLVCDVRALAVSLGQKPGPIREGVATLNGRKIGPKYRVNWTPSEIVFNLDRKRQKQRPSIRRTTKYRYIVDAKRISPRLMRCIEVDSASRLFLAGDSMIPTHNSWSLVYDPLRWVDLPGFRGIIFRRERTQLVGGGGVWDESLKLYPHREGASRGGNVLDWSFPSGARIEFNHLQHEKTKFSHKSKQYGYIALDECTDFTEGQFWYLHSRLRSLSGMRPYMRGATNPDPDSHIRGLIGWWIGEDGFPILDRSGVLRYFVRIEDQLHWADSAAELCRQFDYLPKEDVRPKSLTFIPAKLEHNKILTAGDPEYRANLLAMHEVDRKALLEGNWDVRPVSGDFFKGERVRFLDAPPSDLVEVCRAWDKAASKPSQANPNPDWTAGVKIGRRRNGRIVVLDVKRERFDPLEVEELILKTAEQDGKRVKVAFWQDPAQAGKFDVAHFVRLLLGYIVEVERASKDKQTFAKPFSSQWLAGNVDIVRGPWNDAYINEHEAFPSSVASVKDDQVDGSSLAHLTISKTLSGLAALEAMTRM